MTTSASHDHPDAIKLLWDAKMLLDLVDRLGAAGYGYDNPYSDYGSPGHLSRLLDLAFQKTATAMSLLDD